MTFQITGERLSNRIKGTNEPGGAASRPDEPRACERPYSPSGRFLPRPAAYSREVGASDTSGARKPRDPAEQRKMPEQKPKMGRGRQLRALRPENSPHFAFRRRFLFSKTNRDLGIYCPPRHSSSGASNTFVVRAPFLDKATSKTFRGTRRKRAAECRLEHKMRVKRPRDGGPKEKRAADESTGTRDEGEDAMSWGAKQQRETDESTETEGEETAG